MRNLRAREVMDIAAGACILASGGGGPFSLREPLVNAIDSEGGVRLAQLDEVGDDDLVAVVAGAGSPAVVAKQGGGQKLARAATLALESLEATLEERVKFVASIETGAGNTLIPLAVGARKKLPVIDGAGARRSVPAVTMCTYSGLPITPLQIVSESGTVVGLHVATAAHAEGPLMGVTSLPEFDDAVGLAMWPMRGRTAKQHTSRGTITYAQNLGRAVREATTKKGNPVEAARKFMDGFLLFEGHLKSVESHVSDGLDLLVVVLEKDGEERLRIYGQNESLIAWDNRYAHPVAMAPDLICYLSEKGEPCSNADISDAMKGRVLALIGAAAPADLRTTELAPAFIGALRNMGYGGPYVPIEQLQQFSSAVPRAYRTAHAG